MDRWQLIFIAGAGLLIALQVFRGWRMGVVRQFIQLAALGLAYLAGWWGAQLVVPALKGLGYPDVVLVAIGGLVMGAVVYFAVVLAGAILFKRTGQQESFLVRAVFGFGGAALGGLWGLVLVWIAIVAVRFLGTMAQADVDAAAARRGEARHPGRLTESLAEMKTSLDHAPTGAMVEQVDPIPGKAYDVIGKMVRVLGSAEAMGRFMEYPGAKKLAEHPKIKALKEDPEIVAAIERREFMKLISNPRIVQAANDPDLRGELLQFEVVAALDYAMREK